ncbi:TIGR02757 family protein [Flagellimonas sp. DF-77]|uniref:TIGR02757 family protein n=1 Tax=Flagellimonas algarum TaxID=3230298 RepID=UPI003397DDD0
MKKAELKAFLDEKATAYEHPSFLENDPIQIPHRFKRKEDIEISAFLTATIAWGNRKSIINNAERLMALMQQSPFDFVMEHDSQELEALDGFVHRTFNGTDLRYFVTALQHLYANHDGLEGVFTRHQDASGLQTAIAEFHNLFFSLPHEKRTVKHVSNPEKGSAAKRINMFLRWMVRSDAKGVDFGIWKDIPPSKLSCPLDVHSGRVARQLKLLRRKQNDAKALLELDRQLRKLDAIDPVKYDFALFGLGVFEKF